MARDGAGNYSLPQPAFVTGATISSTAVNSDLSDIATALTNSMARSGEAAATGSQPMAGFRHTGVGNAAARTDYAAAGQVQDGSLVYVGTTAGTSTAITATVTPGISALVTGMQLVAKIGTTCGDTPTFNLNALGAKKIYVPTLAGPAQAMTGDLIAGNALTLQYDATLDSANGGWIVATSTRGWRPIAAATVSAVSVQDFALPSGLARFRLEWEAVPATAAPPFIRYSTDNGATFKAGGTDYSHSSMYVVAGTSGAVGATTGYAQVGATCNASYASVGSLEFYRASGMGDANATSLDATPALVRWAGGVYCNAGVAVTNIRFGFVGVNIATGTITLQGRP